MKDLKNLLKIIDELERVNIKKKNPTVTSVKEFKYSGGEIYISIRIPKEKFVKEIIRKLHELNVDVHAIYTVRKNFNYIMTLILSELK